jgi:hypothetical protein
MRAEAPLSLGVDGEGALRNRRATDVSLGSDSAVARVSAQCLVCPKADTAGDLRE